MRMLLKTASFAAAVLAGTALSLAAPAAAQAQTRTTTTTVSAATTIATATASTATPSGTVSVQDYRDCPDHYVCLWGDASYAGRYIFVPEGNGSPLFRSNIGSFMNDLTTSIWNRTSRRICFYRDTNYQGLLLCMNPGASSPNIGSGANDKISSFQPF